MVDYVSLSRILEHRSSVLIVKLSQNYLGFSELVLVHPKLGEGTYLKELGPWSKGLMT